MFQRNQVHRQQIPGADFANNIATSVEKTSNNIVVNLEKFANAIVPPPPKASHEPARQRSRLRLRLSCMCLCLRLRFMRLCMCRWRRTLNEFSKENLVNQSSRWTLHLPWRTTSSQACLCNYELKQAGQGVMVINANTSSPLKPYRNSVCLLFHAGLTRKRGVNQDSPTCTE